jgi:hypothetical protein
MQRQRQRQKQERHDKLVKLINEARVSSGVASLRTQTLKLTTHGQYPKDIEGEFPREEASPEMPHLKRPMHTTPETGKRRRLHQASSESLIPEDHISRFFSNYPSFQYDPSAPVAAQFQGLRESLGDDRCRKSEARKAFSDAISQEFNYLYGADGTDLTSWQKLCRVLDLESIPDTVTGCRDVSSHP